VRRPLAYVMGLLARTPLRPLLSATR
jgi:hypothetical protein